MFDLERSEVLVDAYVRAAAAFERAADSLAPLIGEADLLLDREGGVAPAALAAPGTIAYVGEELEADGADLSWRVSFVRSFDALPIELGRVSAELPGRDPALARMALDDLIERIERGSLAQMSAALVEVAARSASDPEVAEAVLAALGPYRVWELMDAAHRNVYSNGASFLRERRSAEPVPVWDDIAVPIAVIFGNAVRGRRSAFADGLFAQAEAAVYDDVEPDRDHELVPGYSMQLLAMLAGTSTLSGGYAVDAARILHASVRNPFGGTDAFIGGFLNQPLTPYDHFAVMLRVLDDHPRLAAQLLAPPEVAQRWRAVGSPEFRGGSGRARSEIDADELWERMLSAHGEARHLAGSVIETYLIDAPNGADEAWNRFEAEFASGRTDRRSDAVRDALALKWSEDIPRSVALGNENQYGQQPLDDFLTAVFESDTGFATVTLALQLETRDTVARQVRGEPGNDQLLGRLWEAYGLGLVNSGRADSDTAMSLVEAAAKFAWSGGVDALLPGPATLGVKALKAGGSWLIGEGLDLVPASPEGGRSTPREAVLSFTRVDFHSSAAIDWNVADMLLADPDVQERYRDGLALIASERSSSGGLLLPPPDASDVERSDYAEWFDATFYAGVRDHADPTEVPGDLDGDSRLSAAELELLRLGREVSDATVLARGLLNDAAETATALD